MNHMETFVVLHTSQIRFRCNFFFRPCLKSTLYYWQLPTSIYFAVVQIFHLQNGLSWKGLPSNDMGQLQLDQVPRCPLYIPGRWEILVQQCSKLLTTAAWCWPVNFDWVLSDCSSTPVLCQGKNICLGPENLSAQGSEEAIASIHL